MKIFNILLWGRYLHSKEDIYIKNQIEAESVEQAKEILLAQITEESERETIQNCFAGIFDGDYLFDNLQDKVYFQSNGKRITHNHHIYVEFIDDFIHFLEDVFEKNIPVEESEYGKGIVREYKMLDEDVGNPDDFGIEL